MSVAYLYRWTIKEGRESEFEDAWLEATRAIHRRCESLGARLHKGPERSYWSYARWSSEKARDECFALDWSGESCFALMRECVESRQEELVGELQLDHLCEEGPRYELPMLRSERLLLRPLRYDDAESLLPAFVSDENMRYWSRGPIEKVEELRRYMAWNVDGQSVRCFAICLGEVPNDAMGWLVLQHKRAGEAELGFILRPDAQGQGYAREAVLRAIDYAFDELELRRLSGDVDPDNSASVGLFERLGFKREAHLRENWETHLGVRDSYIYGLLKSERQRS